MKLEMHGQMRLEQQMKLAPHMIQSMEILQLPMLALQERIEQELNSNPVLEIDEPDEDGGQKTEDRGQKTEDYKGDERLDEEVREYIEQGGEYTRAPQPEEQDPKLAAIKNAAAPAQSLHDYLEDQWRLVEADEPVKKAGSIIIDYIDDKGYLSVRLEQLHNKDRTDFKPEDLPKALELIQKLEPPGVGARDVKECLLIQLNQCYEDMSFEKKLVAGHFDKLLENRLPEIAKKMNCSIENINRAIARLSKFDTSPGLQVGVNRNVPISADVIAEFSEESGEYTVRLADDNLPRLRINDYYTAMASAKKTDDKAREFLQRNIRSAQWIIDAIEQRKNTLLKVTRSIVNRQRDFLDKGQLYLKPLPMAKVAEDVGVHIATVSRAVSGKYLQCSWGIIPLRKFFSGGIEDTQGNEKSWEAIRAKLQEIIDAEDKSSPLSDDQIKTKLVEAGITGLARRTIAKYRGIMKIPPARLRKKY
jgi:RNA polymerase sigma-54 factor